MVINVDEIEIVVVILAVREDNKIEYVFQVTVWTMGKVVGGNKTAVVEAVTLETRFAVSSVEKDVKRIQIAAVVIVHCSKDAEEEINYRLM